MGHNYINVYVSLGVVNFLEAKNLQSLLALW